MAGNFSLSTQDFNSLGIPKSFALEIIIFLQWHAEDNKKEYEKNTIRCMKTKHLWRIEKQPVCEFERLKGKEDKFSQTHTYLE